MGMHERAELAEKSREKLREEIGYLLVDIQTVIEENDPVRIYEMLKRIEVKIKGIQSYQQKSDAEIIHQISLEKILGINDIKNDSDSILNESSLDEEHTEHTMLQAARNKEVNEINRELALKEELVAKLMANSSQFVEQSREIQVMENEVKSLQVEKEQLLKALEDVQANNASAKIAESRRKKVKELEKKISELTKKCVEQSRILKSKEKSDEQVRNLTQEIQVMKQNRVKLVRDMRKEAEKFQQYKTIREKEVYKLKDQDRKRKNQMERLRVLHDKQQNVMKRKMEEAYAVNKKLKETLTLQKKIRASREEKGKKTKEFIQRLVNHEVAVIQDTINARNFLDIQLKYREQVAENLGQLKAKAEENPSDYLTREIHDLEEYLDLCTTKIGQIQREIVGSDHEGMVKSRLENIHTVGEAKQVAQQLFDTVEQLCKAHKCELGEWEGKYEELVMIHDEALTKMRKMELTKTVSFEEHRAVLEELEKYKKMEVEVEGIKRSYSAGKKEKKLVKPSYLDYLMAEGKENVDTDESFNDDPDKDPDWEKSPMVRRMRSGVGFRKVGLVDGKAKKRSSGSIEEKVGCQCKTKCQNYYCKCQKGGVICDEDCGCNPGNCENRNNGNGTQYFEGGPGELAGLAKKIRTE